jgi:hypothetical protein
MNSYIILTFTCHLFLYSTNEHFFIVDWRYISILLLLTKQLEQFNVEIYQACLRVALILMQICIVQLGSLGNIHYTIDIKSTGNLL